MGVTVWWTTLDHVPAGLAAELTPQEQQRRRAYGQQGDRDRFTVGTALLRRLVTHETGVGDVAVVRACSRCDQAHGRPRIAGLDVHVSISHSDQVVAVALSHDAAVGVDVERIAPRDVEGLGPIVLDPIEPAARPGDFYRYWCRKEAVVKATGDGLRVPLREVVVSPAHEPPALLAYEGRARPCAMADLDLDPGYAAAVVGLAAGPLNVTLDHVLLTGAVATADVALHPSQPLLR